MAKNDFYYGLHAIESLIELEPERILTLFVTKGRDDQRIHSLIEASKPFGISVQWSERASLTKLARTPHHQGIVAAARPQTVLTENDLDQIVSRATNPVILALDQITDPHNLGACIRSAAAMGAGAVVVARDRSVGMTPTVRKVAAGGAEKIPLIQVTNLARTLEHLKQYHCTITGTLLDENAKSLDQHDFRQPTVIVMGAEDTGLRPVIQKVCDQMIYIPMDGNLQSLNVSVAAGITLYEIFRQRKM